MKTKQCYFCGAKDHTSKFNLNNNSLIVCNTCCSELSKYINKNLIPKSPQNLFLKEKKENK